MRARTGLWEPRVGNDPRRPGPKPPCLLAKDRRLNNFPIGRMCGITGGKDNHDLATDARP